jgi:nitroreductase/NAD-dependent dihydropyrimidine dehydrogenase PreA subunit
MSQISVDTSLCVQDAACVAVCPSRTLALNELGFPEEVPDNHCILCGHCVAVCSCGALTHSGLPDEALLPVSTELPEPKLLDGFLKSRRSIRAYTDAPVSRETLEALLDVARRAPTATNSQRLHWLVFDSAAKVRALSQETLNGLVAAGQGNTLMKEFAQGTDRILRGAPCVVAACAPSDYAWGRQDCAIALTYLELAAEARGLGACWAGYLTRVAAGYEPLRHALAVPEGFTVCGGLMLGTSEFTYHSIPPRKPLRVTWA